MILALNFSDYTEADPPETFARGRCYGSFYGICQTINSRGWANLEMGQ